MDVDWERGEDFRPVPDEDGDWWNENDDGWSSDEDWRNRVDADGEMG